jgi:hypothetical protein
MGRFPVKGALQMLTKDSVLQKYICTVEEGKRWENLNGLHRSLDEDCCQGDRPDDGGSKDL